MHVYWFKFIASVDNHPISEGTMVVRHQEVRSHQQLRGYTKDQYSDLPPEATIQIEGLRHERDEDGAWRH